MLDACMWILDNLLVYYALGVVFFWTGFYLSHDKRGLSFLVVVLGPLFWPLMCIWGFADSFDLPDLPSYPYGDDDG